jgi:hypothetical protein
VGSTHRKRLSSPEPTGSERDVHPGRAQPVQRERQALVCRLAVGPHPLFEGAAARGEGPVRVAGAAFGVVPDHGADAVLAEALQYPQGEVFHGLDLMSMR